jgi:hypothetical protein
MEMALARLADMEALKWTMLLGAILDGLDSFDNRSSRSLLACSEHGIDQVGRT